MIVQSEHTWSNQDSQRILASSPQGLSDVPRQNYYDQLRRWGLGVRCEYSIRFRRSLLGFKGCCQYGYCKVCCQV